jgi:hypothetical protein
MKIISAIYVILFPVFISFFSVQEIYTQTNVAQAIIKDKSKFKHPGIFSTKAEFDFAKAKIKANEEPWKTAYQKLLETNPTTRIPNPQVKVPGSTNPKERADMDEMTLDGEYAYASALLWYFTGEKKYANHAINILNAWSIFQKPAMPLYLTWAVPHFINAAEIMKHTPGSGWKKADIKNFSNMVNDFMWPHVGPPAVEYGSNHGTTANESQFAIAIFLDDKAKFNEALKNFRWLAPKYIFLNYQNRFDGECNETCRDLNHTKMGVLGLFYAAQAAWNQGVDLWKENEDRFAAFAELHAGIMTGRTPVPPTICVQKKGQAGRIFCKGNVSWSTPSGSPPCNETAWEILYNHLSRRLGKSLPHTEFMLLRNRPMGTGFSKRNGKWETLIHANQSYQTN